MTCWKPPDFRLIQGSPSHYLLPALSQYARTTTLQIFIGTFPLLASSDDLLWGTELHADRPRADDARRGGRKLVISEKLLQRPSAKIDNALLKALARAHRWRRQIEVGEYVSIIELAKAEDVNQSYACLLLRLTLLAPAIVEEILNGRQHPGLTLKTLMRPISIRGAADNRIGPRLKREPIHTSILMRLADC
jgi:hypothetical protein